MCGRNDRTVFNGRKGNKKALEKIHFRLLKKEISGKKQRKYFLFRKKSVLLQVEMKK
jgi:hypothetical protein